MKHNYWVSAKYPFAQWEAGLNNPRLNINDYLDFAQKILEIGQRELHYSVRQVAYTQNPFDAKEGYTYVDYLREIANQSERLPFFSFLSEVDRTPCDICYYDKYGSVINKNIENLGRLLQLMHSDKLGPHNTEAERLFYLGYMQHMPPLVLKGLEFQLQRVKSKEPLPVGYYPIIWVKLYSDIWFPEVAGLLEEVKPTSPYNNQELALCHTPALNRFINELRTLTLNLGGYWSFNPNSGQYNHLVSETGVILPYIK
jgi:hypothetical protein